MNSIQYQLRQDDEMEQKDKQCIFCTQKSNSAEHIYPKWMKDFLPDGHQRSHHTITRARVNPVAGIRHLTQSSDGKMARQGDHRSQKLRVVCCDCNNGWMSRVQQNAKAVLLPLIQGNFPALSNNDRLRLANWATLFAMVWERADAPTAAISRQERLHFKETQKPPPGFHIWFGNCDAIESWRMTSDHRGWGEHLREDGSFDFESQLTYGAPGLCSFLVFSSRSNRVTPTAIEIVNGLVEAGGLVKVWPIPHVFYNSVPVRKLSQYEGRDLINRISDLLMSEVMY